MWNTAFPNTGQDYVWLNGQPLSMAATGHYWFGNIQDNEKQVADILVLRPKHGFKLNGVLPANKNRRYVCEKPFGG